MSANIEIIVKEIVQEINHAAISRATRGLNILRNSALTILSRETYGRRYRYGVASVPQATPNPQSGNLRSKWRQEKSVSQGGNNLRIKLKITSKMFYAVYLQGGTSKMAPRPFIEPIRTHARPQIAALFSNL